MANLLNFIALFLSVVAAIGIVHSQIAMRKIRQSVPWAGLRKEIFSESRTSIREWTAALRTLKTGYDQFCRKGLPYVIPDPGFHPIVILPQEQAAWMSIQPEPIFSARKAQVGRIALGYLSPGLDWSHDAFMMESVRKDLTSNLGTMQPAMTEDIRGTIDSAMGLGTGSWTRICIQKAMSESIFRITSRVLVGSPLCESDEYVNNSISYATWLGGGIILVGQYTPWILKPLIGYLGALPVYYYRQKALKLLLPFEAPKDLMTWITQAVLDNDKTKNKPAEFIGIRLLFFFLTATNIMLNLASSDPSDKFWDQLREEAAGVFKTASDWTDRASISKLSLTDSTIRESLRKNPMLTRILLREVVPKEGLILPSGHHMPKGTWVGEDTVGIHHDDRFYSRPDQFEPFRFATRKEDVLTEADKENLTDRASIYRSNQGLATASDIYLAFGTGRHSCPGRWLAAHQLKLMLAYITLDYDIQHIGSG